MNTHKPSTILVWMVGKPCTIITYIHTQGYLSYTDQVNSYNFIAEMAEA